MKKAFKISLTFAAIAVLAACGGGTEEAPANPIAKYAGTYYDECQPGDGDSLQSSVKINDLGAGNFSFEGQQASFKDAACSVIDQSFPSQAGTITLIDSAKFKFSDVVGALPPSICASKNEEVSIDRVKVDFGGESQDFYFYKTGSFFFALTKDGESWSALVYGTESNFNDDDFIDCSAPPA